MLVIREEINKTQILPSRNTVSLWLVPSFPPLPFSLSYFSSFFQIFRIRLLKFLGHDSLSSLFHAWQLFNLENNKLYPMSPPPNPSICFSLSCTRDPPPATIVTLKFTIPLAFFFFYSRIVCRCVETRIHPCTYVPKQ